MSLGTAITMGGSFDCEAVCRRFVLCMVSEALKVQTTVSESRAPRPSKRHKPNSHSANRVSNTSDNEIEQDVFSSSEPLASKAVPQFTRCGELN
jgi:hypothetical protein